MTIPFDGGLRSRTARVDLFAPLYSDSLADHPIFGYTERNLCKERLTGEEGKLCSMLLATIENDADRALFAEIYEQYHERMEQAALRILKDTHDAEDAVQNAFLKIIRNFEKFLELPCKKRPFWCVCIVKNEAITLLRKKKKAIMLESMEDAYDASADIEKALSYEDIIRLFAGLPETYRAVLEMKFLLDCSGKDISQKLGISENAVNVRISRGRAMLREIMEKEALHL